MTLQQKQPQIVWGANTASFAYPLDNWQTYSEPREGSSFIQTVSGVEDSWYVGDDFVLAGDLRWIPSETAGGITGWNGTTGIRAMLEYARRKQPIYFYPDKTAGTNIASYLVEPMNGGHTLEPDGTRTVRLVIRNTTTPYSGY